MISSFAMIPFLIHYLSSTPPTEVLRQVSIERRADGNTNIVLEVPFVHQKNDIYSEELAYTGPSACGPAALTMALKSRGEKISLEYVISKLPNSVYIKGDRYYNLPAGAEVFEKEAISIDATPKAFYKTLSKGFPIILNIQNYDGITGHAVVITGMIGFDGENAEALVIHDPFEAPNRLFEYINDTTLKQPEGYINPIGIQKPFYVS
jgi:hypothetical protein